MLEKLAYPAVISEGLTLHFGEAVSYEHEPK